MEWLSERELERKAEAMDKEHRELDSKLNVISDEELSQISGGELSEEKKADLWERTKRLKMVMTLDDFISMNPPSEQRDYICSIWDEVEVPFSNWGKDGCNILQ